VNLAALVLGTALYIAAGRVIIRRIKGVERDALFAALNLFAVFALYYQVGFGGAVAFVGYVAVVATQFAFLRIGARATGRANLVGFLAPIAALVGVSLLPLVVPPTLHVPTGPTVLELAATMIGFSYLAFRASYLALEVRNGLAPVPTFWQYLGFCFFAPILAVGPISRYSTFRAGVDNAPTTVPPAARAVLRLIVGAVKYQVLAGVFNQLTYSGLLLDGHPHHWVDLPVSAIAYYLYLFCNFSGFCDMAIGAAGLIGIPVEENFRSPLTARSIRDFWNRWHITLSTYMRDVVFTPASKALAARFGPQNTNHATAVSIALVFLLIGLWHGFAWHFVAFGAMHAVGVVTNHYYTLFLRKRLGKDGLAAYNRNPWIRRVAVAVTFVYVSASFFLFANTFPQMREILAGIRWGDA
jgi:D-alanyl-lipoteichoic acid acyltransferase DltB (MBOAT superfamily)